MNLVDQIPVLPLHVLEANIAQNARIVDEHIDAPKVVDSSLDDGFSVLDRIVVGDGLAACSADRLDDFVCGLADCQRGSLRVDGVTCGDSIGAQPRTIVMISHCRTVVTMKTTYL
jgi:hypothetical protein